MSFKNPKNLAIIISVVAALLAGTVLLGGYAGSQPADTEAPAVTCKASGDMAGCPMTAQKASCPKMMAAQGESTGCTKTPCVEGCPKPCCAGENAEGVCDNPCPIPCPKPCCAEDAQKGCCGTAEATGCCAAKTAAE
ncbi:MAG: hypothetical protein ACYSUX_07755 [Planctomycetota bacterium]